MLVTSLLRNIYSNRLVAFMSTGTIFAFLAGFGAIVIWALLPVLVKSIVNHVDVSFFLMQRFLFSTLILSWVIPRIVIKLKFLSKKKLLYFIITLGGNFYLQTWALSQVPASWYVIIIALNPILTLILLRYRLTASTWGGIILALAGTYLFSIAQHGYLFAITPLAMIALLGGMSTWSFYTVLVKDFHSVYSDLELTALSSIVSLAACLLIWTISGFPTDGAVLRYLPETLLISLIVPVAYFLYSYGIRKLPVVTVNAQYLEPILSLIFAALILHECLTSMQYLASGIILTGVLLSTLYSAKS